MIPAVNKYEAKRGNGKAKPKLGIRSKRQNRQSAEDGFWFIRDFVFLGKGDIKSRSTNVCACSRFTTLFNIWFVFVAV